MRQALWGFCNRIGNERDLLIHREQSARYAGTGKHVHLFKSEYVAVEDGARCNRRYAGRPPEDVLGLCEIIEDDAPGGQGGKFAGYVDNEHRIRVALRIEMQRTCTYCHVGSGLVDAPGEDQVAQLYRGNLSRCARIWVSSKEGVCDTQVGLGLS